MDFTKIKGERAIAIKFRQYLEDNYETLNQSDFEEFVAHYHAADLDELFIYLIKNIFIGHNELKAFLEICNVSSIETILLKIPIYSKANNIYLEGQNYGILASKVFYAFDLDTLTEDQIRTLILRSANDSRLTVVYDYVKLRFLSSEQSKKPSWVSKNPGESVNLMEEVSVGMDSQKMKSMYFDRVVDEVFDKFTIDNGEEDEEDESKVDKDDLISTYLSIVSEGDLDKSLLEDSLQQFRVWGPPNRGNYDCPACPNGKGPCRMLLCNCKENTEDDEYYYDYEWFSGNCDNCRKKILDKSHCIRRPLIGGGWRGCFCSAECMKANDEMEDRKEDFLIRSVVEKLKENGIMDRTIVSKPNEINSSN